MFLKCFRRSRILTQVLCSIIFLTFPQVFFEVWGYSGLLTGACYPIERRLGCCFSSPDTQQWPLDPRSDGTEWLSKTNWSGMALEESKSQLEMYLYTHTHTHIHPWRVCVCINSVYILYILFIYINLSIYMNYISVKFPWRK